MSIYNMKWVYPQAEFNNDGIYYSFDELDDFIEILKISGISDRVPYVYRPTPDFKGYKIMNVPCAMDTETTSYLLKRGKEEIKTAFMYIWMVGVNGYTIYGRRWEEFLKLLKRMKEEFRLSVNKRMLIYIHNMGFDWQFFHRIIPVDELMLMDSRKALYAVSDCYEFRCSYLLTGESLAKVGEHLLKYKCEKLVGDLDYSLCRTWATPLSEDKELPYCINDVRVQMCKIKECMEEEGGTLANVPYTLTGYVRRDVRNAMKADNLAYKQVQNLKLTLEEYKMWKRSFQGGFTHQNAAYSGRTCEDVTSYDFTSSYPTQMLAQFYPMSNGTKVEWGDWKNDFDNQFKKFVDLMRTHILVFDVKMTNVRLRKNMPDAPIARAKCYIKHGCTGNDNVRIWEADYLETTCDNITFETYQKYYTFDFEIGTCYKYMKGYLPLPIIKKILEYYGAKTTLKGIVGKEQEYMKGKAKLNSIFGNFVMDIIRSVFIEWGGKEQETNNSIEENVLDKYNKSKQRVTWYPWGCMITAYARKALLDGIYEVGKWDYIYSDTDSMKIMNAQDHLGYILQYNREITEKLEKCMDYYHLDKSLLRPKNKKGVEKPLGIWDFDGHYSRFKTLHAKCYISEMDDDERNDKDEIGLHCTIAGLPKKSGVEYLSQFKNPFEEFKDGMEIKKSGKKCRTYSDGIYEMEVTDYLGKTVMVKTYGGCYLEEIPFKIDLNGDYELFLKLLGVELEEQEV